MSVLELALGFLFTTLWAWVTIGLIFCTALLSRYETKRGILTMRARISLYIKCAVRGVFAPSVLK